MLPAMRYVPVLVTPAATPAAALPQRALKPACWVAGVLAPFGHEWGRELAAFADLVERREASHTCTGMERTPV